VTLARFKCEVLDCAVDTKGNHLEPSVVSLSQEWREE